jgi:essential nuclear protein 1
MPYSGSTSLFLRVLINKKYSLPSQVVDALQVHFAGFSSEERALPVLWHQALLAFVQRYRARIDKDKINALIKIQFHPKLTPEIRRELYA